MTATEHGGRNIIVSGHHALLHHAERVVLGDPLPLGGLRLAYLGCMVVVIGWVAALCSVSAFVPQAWQIVKTRKTKDLSAVMWTLQVIGFVVWLFYGLMLAAWPIVAVNAVCALLAGFILAMKLLPHHLRHAVADRIDPDVPSR